MKWMELTDMNGKKLTLQVIQASEVSVSQAWHGARCNVQDVNGTWREVREEYKTISESLING